ncbi:MAG: putative DNA binding domain-containing protein [Candidatus Auribacterota bacterium]|nr:putative DNA binding domain-containing protein [Candidatus Auribacterota bacterium]
MNAEEIREKFNDLFDLPSETEWVEFKIAKNNIHFNKLGKYFSALSNEANLKRRPWGWLILGVQEYPREIIGTTYRKKRQDLDSLKHEVARHMTNHITFEEIHELILEEGRVLLFQIPAALSGVPTGWKGHYYGRDDESLVALNAHEYEQIRGQAIREDWSAGIQEKATIKDLAPDALAFARKQYREKHPQLANEINRWDNATFLNKAKVCIEGKITNAALLLLGKADCSYLISPAQAQITWVLRDKKGVEKDYEHFNAPLILAVDNVLAKVRNLTIRHMPSGTLFPMEIRQYDLWVMREMLNNCIAHQDYPMGGRINVVESPNKLLFTNMGSFLPGSVDEVIRRDAPPEQYRNGLLTQAMFNLNMIDTIGSGIKRIFRTQRDRYFPMPDYDLGEPDRVKAWLFGTILDENYTRLLTRKTDLDLWDVIALDKVQKKQALSEAEFRSLKSQNLVEGRRPNLHVSSGIAATTGTKAAYIRQRAFDKSHYKKMVLAYLEKFGSARRDDFDELLLDKLSDVLTKKQKKTFIMNLLQEMRREDRSIASIGATRSSRWILHNPSPKN